MWKAIFFLFSPPYILLFRSVKTRARMQSSGKHCLKWNNFQENCIWSTLLRNDQDFANVICYVSLSFEICGKVSMSKKDWDFTLDHSTGGLDIPQSEITGGRIEAWYNSQEQGGLEGHKSLRMHWRRSHSREL